MTEPPHDAFTPAHGKLGQMIFENPGAHLPPRLEFFIEISFKPFSFEGESLSPILRLNGLILPGLKKWTDLADRDFSFPNVPKAGSLEAGVHLFHVFNPAEVTALSFGSASRTCLPVTFETEIDFEVEADCPWGWIPLSIRDCSMEVSPLRVATSIEKRNQGDPSAITESIRELVDVNFYQPITKVPGGFEFPLL